MFSKVIECLEKSNTWMNTKHSKTNWPQKKHGIQKKWIEYKTFELKYGNAKLTNVCKYK